VRIIQIAPHCDDVGNGVVNVAVDLACTQADLGNAVAFVGAKGSFDGLLANHKVELFEVDFRGRNPASILRAYLALRDVFEQFRPDIVHAHMVPGAVLARLARPARSARGRRRFRLVTHVHNEPQWQAILMGLGDMVIAVGAAVSQSMAHRGIPERKLRIVKNGTVGSPRRRNGAGGHMAPNLKRPCVITVARLFSQKGIDDLIAAFAALSGEFPNAHLYILGQGPEREKFEAQAAASSAADSIHFLGFVKDPRPYLAQTDVFVLASRKDPFPLSILEAREAGCAIVATSVDGIPEALEYGQAGILVPPDNPAVLASALCTLFGRPEEIDLWRARSQHNIDWLGIRRVTGDVLAIYAEVLADGARADSPAAGRNRTPLNGPSPDRRERNRQA
jgi:glycosyltransferase involved in cell wall biosynthesis